MPELIGKDSIDSRVFLRCVLVGQGVAELIGKNSIYSRVILRCALVGSLCI